MHSRNVRVRALTWAEVIEAAGHRLKFINDHLGYQPSAQQALDFLRTTHEKYLPEQLAQAAPAAPST